MFTLLQGLWKYFFRKREYFVVIIGLDNAGKTTLLERIKDLFIRNYRGIPVEKITSTVGLNVGKVDIGSSRLILWDLGGQQDLQSLWDKYYAECHGVVYVIDSSDPDSLAISAQIFKTVICHADLETAPLLVLANKQDRMDALPLTVVEAAFGSSEEAVGNRDYRIQRVSALKGTQLKHTFSTIIQKYSEGVREGIEWLTHRIEQCPTRPLKQDEL